MNVLALSEQKPMGLCKKECAINKNNSTSLCTQEFLLCRNNCSRKDKDCNYECNFEKSNCIDRVNFKYSNCPKNCKYIFKNKTCGNHELGEVFTEGCELCKCEFNGKVNCKKTDFCNYDKVLRNQTVCKENNGIYQPLCNGPYFDIVCSKDNFCLCGGDNNYSCPSDYACLHEFNPSLTRKGHTVAGWKTLLGVPLGNIGICAKKS